MSLQHAAKHLEKHGRNGDTMLVHMSPKEVKSLNDLAMAHGGHLTTNPTTGLPEAGFLSSILPMVAGVALNTFAPGLGALGSGLLVGGGTAALTGDIKKGLMAGLGAYGGSQLGAGLMGAGAGAIGQEATNQAVQQATAQNLQGEAYNQAIQKQVADKMAEASTFDKLQAGLTNPNMTMSALGGGMKAASTLGMAGAPLISEMLTPKTPMPSQTDKDMGQRYTYNAGTVTPTPTPDASGREQTYFRPTYTPVSADAARSIYGYAGGGPVEMMSNANAVGANTGYPMADINKPVYASPFQTPVSSNVVHGTSDTGVNPMTGEMLSFADGGVSHLGDYSDGGRLLRGPGDGVSDSIPATIGQKQPARLADGEFVVPARIVSELGNGSTEAGARKLYAMMDRVQKARGQTVGKGKVAKNSRAEKYLPA